MEELTQEQNYRFTIIEAINFYKQAKNDLFLHIANVAMAGDLNEVNEVFNEGDEIPPDISYFENYTDKNVRQLLKTNYSLEKAIRFLMDANNISEEELDITVE